MRVAYCVFGFAAQKDKIYVVVSSIVLTVLLYSFFQLVDLYPTNVSLEADLPCRGIYSLK